MIQFKKGQTVYCHIFGEGDVKSADAGGDYPIFVLFSNVNQARYTTDGQLIKGTNQSLYHARPEIIVPKWQPEPGQWCWFWDSKDFAPWLGQFEQMNARKYRDTESRNWDFCEPFIGELPSYLKEVEK